MIYLASPYSNPDPLIRKTRFLLAEQVTAELMNRRLTVFSPIVYTHEMALKYSFPADFAFWQAFCIGMLRKASSLYVLQISGTDESVGVQAEIAFAISAGIPIHQVDENAEVTAWLAS